MSEYYTGTTIKVKDHEARAERIKKLQEEYDALPHVGKASNHANREFKRKQHDKWRELQALTREHLYFTGIIERGRKKNA